jgi:hypothetical protein
MEQLCSHSMDFLEIWYLNIFGISLEKIKVSLKSEKNNGYCTWRSAHFFKSYLAQFLLEWEMFQTGLWSKAKRTCIFSDFFPPRKSCRLWDNVEKYYRPVQATDDIVIRRMRIACCIPKTKNTHSEYVILIAFPRQQRWYERAWVLRYTYIVCLAQHWSHSQRNCYIDRYCGWCIELTCY